MIATKGIGPRNPERTAPQEISDIKKALLGASTGMCREIPPGFPPDQPCMWVDVSTDALTLCGKLSVWSSGWSQRRSNQGNEERTCRNPRFYCPEHGEIIHARIQKYN